MSWSVNVGLAKGRGAVGRAALRLGVGSTWRGITGRPAAFAGGVRGSVVVVDPSHSDGGAFLGALPPRRASAVSPPIPKKNNRGGRSRRHQIPGPYLELVRESARGADVEGSMEESQDSPASEVDVQASATSEQSPTKSSSEQDVGDAAFDAATNGLSSKARRKFWRSVRQLAKARLEAIGPDVETWQRRTAAWRESLWVEELNTLLELEQWRFTVDTLGDAGEGLFWLDVTSLGEALTPHLLDSGLRGVRVQIRCVQDNSEYNATVQPGSTAGALLLSAPDSLEHAVGPFEIEFKPHRFPQISMHQALESAQTQELVRATVLEPGSLAPPSIPPPSSAAAEALPESLNEGQRRAVAAALAWSSSSPLVLWGPPGTGKTTLASFVIWHLIQQRPMNVNILATAPSNTGADVLCSKLARLGLDSNRMLRLNALGRNVNTLPADLHSFCRYGRGDDGRQTFVVPPLEELRRFRVIVTTCICAAHIANAIRAEGGAHGWFSHVVVDEAGEATEPETLVPLALLRSVGGVPILLGDHFQLGPLVISMLANHLGSLATSMLERVVNDRFDFVRADAQAHGADGLNRDALAASEDHGLFFLTESFRSHSSIMSLYSHIFYADQLEHRGRPRQNALMPFFESRGLNVPILMHNVVGNEIQEAGTPSIANFEEVRLVQEYVLDLLRDERLELDPSDVGVITPYTRQLQALERQFSNIGSSVDGLQCGTVERFQGQERTVVIISTVRSSGRSSRADNPERRPIGFVGEPKRLNVAISRAVAGLIIVGDLQMLAMHSAHWRKLIRKGQAMGVVRGARLDLGSRRARDDVSRMSAAKVDDQAFAVHEPVSTAKASAAWDALTSSA
eukprot:TRINITY_DN26317_c0_g1_i1.p1 TRINITY_DN26317_c0_g1~~TRINITY_DN26317_c0_g1_i1.p1  ORF type:complete len:854 (+),score=86.90 TRINITY_DN26317_c0_g1_i1:36-2597(+)